MKSFIDIKWVAVRMAYLYRKPVKITQGPHPINRWEIAYLPERKNQYPREFHLTDKLLAYLNYSGFDDREIIIEEIVEDWKAVDKQEIC